MDAALHHPLACQGAPRTPLRAKMIRDRPWPRLAPRTPEAYVAAVAGLATFSHCSPDRLSSEQSRAYLPPRLVERRLAWSSCNQVACGLTFFSTRTLGWAAVHLDFPPRTGRPPFPRVLRLEAMQRLCTRARNRTHRALRMTTYAAGLRVSAGVRRQRTDIERDRLLLRVKQGQGRQDR